MNDVPPYLRGMVRKMILEEMSPAKERLEGFYEGQETDRGRIQVLEARVAVLEAKTARTT